MDLISEQIEAISKNPLNNRLDKFRDDLRDDPSKEDIADLLFALIDSRAAYKLGVVYTLFSLQKRVRSGKVVKLDLFRDLIHLVVNKSSDDVIWAAVFRLIKIFPRRIDLTSEQIKTILENPLDKALDKALDNFRDNLGELSRKEVIESLLAALSTSTAACKFHRPEERLGVRNILNSIRGAVVSGEVTDFLLFHDLIHHVVNRSSDDVIWTAVFSLIDIFFLPAYRLLTMLRPTFTGTPCKANRLTYSDTGEIVEAEIFQEIKGCTFRNVEGFWDKFFPAKRRKKIMLERIMREHNGQRWTGFPNDPEEEPVWEWLRSLEERHMKDADYKLHTVKDAHQFDGQMVVFLRKSALKASNNDTLQYKDVLVVGDHRNSYYIRDFKENLLQLAYYVRCVFTDQPMRRFVHAFSLYGSKMELWVFDRSGPYSSGIFDIHEEPHKFASALVGYATMDHQLLGLDMFISRRSSRTIQLDGKDSKKTKITLEKAMVRRKTIVCSGTTCYITRDGDVAKFSWVSAKQKPEMDPLKQAELKGVKGVAQLVAHGQFTSIEELRKGLKFSDRYDFYNNDPPSSPIIGAVTLRHSSSFSKKRKLSPDHMSSRSKRRQTTSQEPKLANVVDNQQLMSKNNSTPSLYMPGAELWENRIYSCLVVRPAGARISDFRTLKELLEALRDAIKAHRSLYIDGGILHRDISCGNIIITDPEKTGFHGMLIDLDQAKMNDDSGPSGARQPTGTVPFMAIEVLQAIGHTYRHDLESFFYVLIWMCACQSWSNGFGSGETPIKTSKLRRWETGTFEDIAFWKKGCMHIQIFRELLDEFPKALDPVKDLCWKIRDILFPYLPDHSMSVRTLEGEPDEVYYTPIIKAYDAAIQGL